MTIGGVGGVSGANAAYAQEQQVVNNVVEEFTASQFTWLFNHLMQTAAQCQEAMRDDEPNGDN